MESWNRKWRTLWCWSSVYVGWKIAQAKGRSLPEDKKASFWEQRHEHFASLVWNNIRELRGWWVKVGQFLSTRSDLLPQQYIHHLIKLQDMMPTSPFEQIERVLREELGEAFEGAFLEIDKTPLASASVGQVHKAVLADGTRVVVKVQHGDVASLLALDMQNLKQLSWAFGLLEPGMDFSPVLEEWQSAAAKELDFRYESAHQQRAFEAVKRSKIDVVIPQVFPQFATKKVLVMEFVDGFKITDTEKLDALGVDRRELMYKLADCFAYQILVDGFFHGDPHPGNILVRLDEETRVASPVVLDWGLVKEFGLSAKIAFAKLVYSVSTMNVMGLMEAFEEMGFKFKNKQGAGTDPEVYLNALRVVFRDGDAREGEGKGQSVRHAAGAALERAKKSGLRGGKKLQDANPLEDWPRDIIFFVRVASLLHGLCVQLEADIPFMSIMAFRAQQCLCSRFAPPSPEAYFQFCWRDSAARRWGLERRVGILLQSLFERGLVLGCQVAVHRAGECLVDAAVGKMGPTDARPVSPDSLFCAYTATKGMITACVLSLLSQGELQLSDPICSWLDGFIRYHKRQLTVEQLLTHTAGLHRALPPSLTIAQLASYRAMVGCVEDASPAPIETQKAEAGAASCEEDEEGHGEASLAECRYAYLTYAWVAAELVRCVSGLSIETFLRERVFEPIGVAKEIFFPLPAEAQREESSEQRPTQTQKPSSRAKTETNEATRPSEALTEERGEELISRRISSSAPGAAGGGLGGGGLLFANKSLRLSASASSLSASSREGFEETQQERRREFTSFASDGEASSPPRSSRRSSRASAVGLLLSPSLRLAEAAGEGRETEKRAEANASKTSREAPQETEAEGFGKLPEAATAITAETPLLWRLTSARRKVSLPSALQKELLSRMPREAESPSPSQGPGIPEAAPSAQKQKSPLSAPACVSSERQTEGRVNPRRRRQFTRGLQQGPASHGSLAGAVSLERLPRTCSQEALAASGPEAALEKASKISFGMEERGAVGEARAEGVWEKRFTRSLIDVSPPLSPEQQQPASPSERGGARLSPASVATDGFRLPDARAFSGEEDSEGDSEQEALFAPRRTANGPAPPRGVSALELLQRRPHVLDPLLFDSRRLLEAVVPALNCRCTARGLSLFYQAVGDCRLFDRQVMNLARTPRSRDTSVEALVLTGGSSRRWGLGFQVFPCAVAQDARGGALWERRAFPEAEEKAARKEEEEASSSPVKGAGSSLAPEGCAREAFAFAEDVSSGADAEAPKEAPRAGGAQVHRHRNAQRRGRKALPRRVVGFGSSDTGGCVGICIPELQLSVAVLVNDYFTGPEAAKIILGFILKCFGLIPNWQDPVSLQQILRGLS